MLVCTATAIMILLYSGLKFGENAPQGVQVTQSALNEHLGSAGGIFLTIVRYLHFLLLLVTIIMVNLT